jgi:hypothetical protein
MQEIGDFTKEFVEHIHENFPNMCFRRLPDSVDERRKRG